MNLLILRANGRTCADRADGGGGVGPLVGRSLEEVVLQGIIRRDARLKIQKSVSTTSRKFEAIAYLRIKVQHSQNQVFEFQVVGDAVSDLTVSSASGPARLDAENVVQLSRAGLLVFSLASRLLKYITAVRILVEELSRLMRLIENVLRWHAQNLDNLVHLIDLVGTRKERLAGVHLHENASQRPHVDGQVVGDPKQHLWRPIEARLNVLVYLRRERMFISHCTLLESEGMTYPLAKLTRTAEVDDFDCRSFGIAEKNIFGF